MLVLEELSRADAGVGVTVAVHTSAGTLPILAHGTAEQIERFVPPLAAGEELAAFALTEPGAGSDAGAHPHPRRRRPHHRIEAVVHERLARVHVHRVRARGGRHVSAFLVRAGADGFAVVREEEKLGLNSSSTADLSFEDTPGERARRAAAGACGSRSSTLDGGRIGIAAQAVGIAQAGLDVADRLREGAHRVRPPDRRDWARSSRSSPTCRPRSRRRGRSCGAPRA